jgi:hypothetical protein
MNAHSPLADAFATDAPGWDRPAFERQIALLGEIAEAGLDVVHAVRDQAVAATQSAEPSRIDFGLAYERAARAVRMTLALQRRYILDLKFELRHGEPAPIWDNPARKKPVHAVDRIGHGLTTGGLSEAKAVKQLTQSLDDTLDAWDRVENLDDDLPEGEFNDIIAKVCKDLGLAPDWLERTQERLSARPPSRTAVSGGGGPSAERSEEPMVVGAGHRRRRFTRSYWRNTS